MKTWVTHTQTGIQAVKNTIETMDMVNTITIIVKRRGKGVKVRIYWHKSDESVGKSEPESEDVRKMPRLERAPIL